MLDDIIEFVVELAVEIFCSVTEGSEKKPLKLGWAIAFTVIMGIALIASLCIFATGDEEIRFLFMACAIGLALGIGFMWRKYFNDKK